MSAPLAPEILERANEQSRRLRELIRAPEILVMPGAYDVISARLFESLGFQAVQGSSGAIAATFGLPDGEVLSRDETVEVYRRMAGAVAVPVNADGEKGFGDAEEVGETVRLMIDAGAAGMNLEDSAPRVEGQAPTLVDLEEQRRKILALLGAKQSLGSEFFLNARVDAFMTMSNPEDALAEAVRRGNAYAELGADCIFYPRVNDPETIRTLVKEVGAPVSILAGAATPSVQALEDLGVARVSYGYAFFMASLPAVKALAQNVLGKGDPSQLLKQGIPMAEMSSLVRRPA